MSLAALKKAWWVPPLLAIVAALTYPYWSDLPGSLPKLWTNRENVSAAGLPIHPAALAMPYTSLDGHHQDSERLGIYRFYVPLSLEHAVPWYQARLPSERWDVGTPDLSRSRLRFWSADLREGDTLGSVKIRIFAASSWGALVLYHISEGPGPPHLRMEGKKRTTTVP